LADFLKIFSSETAWPNELQVMAKAHIAFGKVC
jgi:hypothetical protein